MKSGSQNLLILVLFVMCFYQIKQLGRTIYESIDEEIQSFKPVKTKVQYNEHSFDKPYVFETTTKKKDKS